MSTYRTDDSSDNAETHLRARRVVDYARSQAESVEACMSPPPRPLPLNGSVPGYSILEEIHRGGQGVVYRATQISTKREVALKVLRNGSLNSVDRGRFDREVRLLSQLRHPNLVSLQDGGVADGSCYLVMDFIEGEALDRHVERNQLPSREIVNLLIKVCDAVHAAHLRGIVHRDLKPSNIRIDLRGEPHVLDFGLAKLVGKDFEDATKVTITGQFVGSLPWAAPEQVDGNSDRIDVRTDVYALGVILYVLVVGQFPYEVAGGMHAAVDSIVSVEPTRPRSIDRAIDQDLETIILKCLNKDRQRRYEGAGDIARELRRFLAREPIEARGDSTWYVLTKTVRRHRGVATALALLLVLVLAYAATATVLLGRARIAERRAEESASDAREMFRHARDGMSYVVSEVSNQLNKVGGAASVRQSILEGAFDRLSKLAAGGSEDPLLQADLAQSHGELGDIALAIGKIHEAKSHFASALEIRKSLAEAEPDNDEFAERLSIAWVRYGDVLKVRPDWPGAVEAYENAFHIDERLVEKHPDDAHYHDNFFWSHDRLGYMASLNHDPDRAAEYHHRALPIALRVVQLDPDNPVRLFALATAYLELGMLETLDNELLCDYISTAEHLCERVVQLDPLNPLYQLRLASIYGHSAAMANRVRDFDGAARYRRLSYKTIEKLAIGDPNVIVYQEGLLRTVNILADSEADLGNVEEARRILESQLDAIEDRARLAPPASDFPPAFLEAANSYGRVAARDSSPEDARLTTQRALSFGRERSQDPLVSAIFLGSYASLLLEAVPNDLQDPVLALEMSHRAVELSRSRNPQLIHVLALAECRNGHVEQAQATNALAVSLLPVREAPVRIDYESSLARCLDSTSP